MASGFIILKDGRSATPRYTLYDVLLQSIASHLPEGEFREWLKSQTADETDEESGFGGFYRGEASEYIKRWLDLRELTEENQNLFWKAVQSAVEAAPDNEMVVDWLQKMLQMNRLIEAGDHPDNLSDWRKGYVEPPSGLKSGPGW